MKQFSKNIRRGIGVFWILLIVGVVFTLFLHPEYLDAHFIGQFLEKFGIFLLPVYFFISILRGFTLIPSTPLIIAWVLIFPEYPGFVFLISLLGIVFSSLMLYYFSEAMGFDTYFRKHAAYKKIHTFLEKYGFPLVAVWSFAPVVPTDIICYVAGIVRMNVYKFLFWVLLWESIICTILIYGGNEILEKIW